MVNGAVRWFDATRGFGFIQPDGGSNVFVHKPALEGAGVSGLDCGDRVTFDLETDCDGRQSATNIALAD